MRSESATSRKGDSKWLGEPPNRSWESFTISMVELNSQLVDPGGRGISTFWVFRTSRKQVGFLSALAPTVSCSLPWLWLITQHLEPNPTASRCQQLLLVSRRLSQPAALPASPMAGPVDQWPRTCPKFGWDLGTSGQGCVEQIMCVCVAQRKAIKACPRRHDP